jgi:hypothetical protein
MKAPSTAALLDLWEDGLAATPGRRALAALAAIHPEVPRESLGALTIGQRDADILRLRELLFGRLMFAIAACPHCGRKLEIPLDTQRLLSGGTPAPAFPAEISLELAGHSVTLRLPTALDLVAAEAAPDPELARALIFQRCVLAAYREGAPVGAEELPEEVIAGAAQTMADADPLADILLRLPCSECGNSWTTPFDIVSFLWMELDAWARRTLYEVHVLAQAYGWSEREIAALSAARRRWYLEMVGA